MSAQGGGVFPGRRYLPREGGVCPGRGCLPRGVSAQEDGVCPGGVADTPREQNDRKVYKHYLATTSLRAVKILPCVMYHTKAALCLYLINNYSFF